MNQHKNFQSLKSWKLGVMEAFEFFHEKFGTQLPGTCRDATHNDTALIHHSLLAGLELGLRQHFEPVSFVESSSRLRTAFIEDNWLG